MNRDSEKGPAGRFARGVIRAIARPWVSILLAVVIFLMLQSLPRYGSTLGLWLPWRTHPTIRFGSGPSPAYVLRASDGAIRVVPVDPTHIISFRSSVNISWSKGAIAEARSNAVELGICECNVRPRFRGFAAWTSVSVDHSIYWYAGSPPPSLLKDEERIVRSKFAALLATHGVSPVSVAVLQKGDGIQVTPIWGGYVFNALLVTSLVVCLGSLSWIPQQRQRLAERRLRAKHLCPRCRYDIQGLSTDLCPECGERLHVPN